MIHRCAPMLSGRGFDPQYTDRGIKYEVPETAMAPWGQRLTAPNLVAVTSYVIERTPELFQLPSGYGRGVAVAPGN
jgi:hypothetical protein